MSDNEEKFSKGGDVIIQTGFACEAETGKDGDLVIQSGYGCEDKTGQIAHGYEGSIRFKVGDHEVLTILPGGEFLVNGRFITNDRDVHEAFKAFIDGSKAYNKGFDQIISNVKKDDQP